MRLTPTCSVLHRSTPPSPHFRHFKTSAPPPTPRPFPRTVLYIFHVSDSDPLSIHCKSDAIRSFSRNRPLPLVRVRDPNWPIIFSPSGLFKSFKTYSGNRLHLLSSELIFYAEWNFSLGLMSMDLSSVPAAFTSHGLPSVTGTTIEVASPQACTPGLAGLEPSGTFIHPGQHLQPNFTVKGL